MRSNLCRRVLAFSVLALPAAGQTLKLNGPLAREHYGHFGMPITSPDGEYVVYDASVPVFVPNGGYTISELWSVSTWGKQGPVRLKEAGAGISRVHVTFDGEHVLYLQGYPGDTLGNPGSSELAGVPIDGSRPPVVLSDPLGFVPWFEQSRDGAHVVYLSHPRVGPGPSEIFSVPIIGGAPLKLNGPLVPSGNVDTFALSNDGRLAVYTADQDTDDVVELFVVPVDASQPARKLPVPLVPGGDVRASPLFDLDASHVFYLADQEEDERFELFSVPTDGSQSPRKLNGPLVPGGDVGVRYESYLSFTLTPDGRWILYGADQDTDERFELYGVPADGSRTPVKLTSPADHDVAFMGVSHDSAWMLYLSDPSGTDTYELFSVPVDGSAPARRLSGPMAPGGSVSFNPQVTFDSRRVVYTADQDVDEMRELYGVPIDGSAPPAKLNGPLQPDGDVGPNEYYGSFWVMQDGVLYQADQEQDGLFELYFTPLSGGVARKLVAGPVRVVAPSQSFTQSPPLDFGKVMFSREDELLTIGVEPGARPTVLDVLELGVVGAVESVALTPAGEHAVYRAREEGDDAPRSYSVPTAKPSARVPFHPELAFQSDWRVVPDDSRLVFFARPAPEGARGLYSATPDGTGAAALLSGSLGAFSVTDFQDDETFVISPDGRRVVFLASSLGHAGLFSAPADGSAPALHLSAALPTGVSVGTGMKISADGSTVAFLSAGSGVGALYTVPIDGSAPAVSVAVNEPITGWISAFQIDARGERVVFLRPVGPGLKLFSVHGTGGVAPVRLDTTPRGRRDVTRFAIVPDGTRVVYLADQNADETYELFRAPIDGSAPAVRLSAALPAGRDVRDFQVASDGRRVVYRASTLTDVQNELFSVPVDASRAPVRLNGSLAAGGSVQDYRISPDGKQVVYLADQESDEVVELYSTRIQGSRRQAKLSSPLVPGGDVHSFEISSDSRTVVFTAERSSTPEPFLTGGLFTLTLLAAPIGGQEKATQLAGPFHGGGTVLDYRLSADASVVVYRAGQDLPGVIELYAARRGPGPSSPVVER